MKNKHINFLLILTLIVYLILAIPGIKIIVISGIDLGLINFMDGFLIFVENLIDRINIEVMLGINAGILAIFIPLGIYIFDREGKYVDLDRNLLTHKINAHLFLVELGLIFIPLLVWDKKDYHLSILLLILWGLGIFFIINRLGKIYAWVRAGVRQQHEDRMNYLGKLNAEDKLVDSWRSCWATVSSEFEVEFFEIFREKINGLIMKKKEVVARKLLNDFAEYWDKRSIEFKIFNNRVFEIISNWESFNFKLIANSWKSIWGSKRNQSDLDLFKSFASNIDKLFESEDFNKAHILLGDFNYNLNDRGIGFVVIDGFVFSKILEWHFKIWEIEYIEEEGNHKNHDLLSVSMILHNMIELIVKRSLRESQSFCFFEHIKKHIEKYGDKEVRKENPYNFKYYYQHVPMYREFFENVCDCPESRDVWRYFPSKWKVTLLNLEDKDNGGMSRWWWREFVEWSYKRINIDGDKNDRCLSDVSEELFPEVNPIDWAIILTFLFRGYSSSGNEDPVFAKIRSLIEKPRKFGFGVMGHGWEYGGDWKDDFGKELEDRSKNTAELAYYLFRNDWNNNIERYISGLENMKKENYKNDEKINNRVDQILRVFNGIKEVKEEKEKKNEK